MRWLCSIIISCLVFPAIGQSSLAVSDIPDSLKTKADAVVRYHTTKYTRVSVDKVIEYQKYAITVLNKNGDHFARLYVPYDKSVTVNYINATAYDSDGKITEKLKKTSISDYASYPDFTLFSDNRVKSITPLVKQYPTTYEFEFETISNGFIGFSTWMPQDDYRLAVQKSELVFLTPENISFRFMNLNFTPAYAKDKEGVYSRHTWKVSGMKAIEREQFSPSPVDCLPMIYLAPNEFKYEGFPGNLQSWNTYGKWSYNLNLGRDELPETTVNAVKELIKSTSDTLEMIKAIYSYMQNRTRYVSIQLGIGGLQPMRATDVDKSGYGDCKALSNYTRALLKIAGIQSYYAEIGNGYRKIRFPEFVSLNQSNHVILCVPLSRDTVWLECTSKNYPAGYIGLSNSNRYALLITADGGKLVRTPAYKKNITRQDFYTRATIHNDGKATFTSRFEFRGGLYDQALSYVIMSEKERREQLLKNIPLNSLSIQKIVVNDQKQTNPNISLDLELTAEKYGSVSSGRMFVELNPFNKWSIKPENNSSRRSDIVINIDYMEADTVSFRIPAGYAIEYIPETMLFETVFGTYKAQVIKEKEDIFYIRTFSINEGRYDKSMYADFSRFIESVAKADNSKMLLKKI